jgi:hypothetical protein
MAYEGWGLSSLEWLYYPESDEQLSIIAHQAMLLMNSHGLTIRPPSSQTEALQYRWHGSRQLLSGQDPL